MKCFYLVVLSFFFQNGFSMQMSPMEAEFVIGDDQMVEFNLQNGFSYPVAMKVGIYNRDPDHYGNEGKYREVGSDIFEIVKPNIILMAKGDSKGRDRKTFRIYLKKKLQIKKEQAYRIIAEQVPVDLDKSSKNKSKVRFLARFVGALYLTPKKSEPIFKVKDVSFKRGVVQFSVENNGTRRNFIEDLKIIFSGKNGAQNFSKTFSGDELINIYHHTILAGRKRIFNFRIPSQYLKQYPNTQNVKISFN